MSKQELRKYENLFRLISHTDSYSDSYLLFQVIAHSNLLLNSDSYKIYNSKVTSLRKWFLFLIKGLRMEIEIIFRNSHFLAIFETISKFPIIFVRLILGKIWYRRSILTELQDHDGKLTSDMNLIWRWF